MRSTRRPTLPCPLGPAALLAAAAFAFGAAAPAHAADPGPPDLPLEELLNLDVQTASRKSQRLQDVAAAVHVITREDIERSGATSLPEALRLAPGMHVAQVSADRWAVTARGFNGRFANKLLVLLNGRSLYSPLFSGVLWETQEISLDEIERIEVIRGPNAALWGANAVNGVINIITRHARESRGTQASVTAGDALRYRVGASHGMAAGGGDLRMWTQATRRDSLPSSTGLSGNDGSRTLQFGLRGNWTLEAGRRLMLSGVISQRRAGDLWLTPDPASPTGVVPMSMSDNSERAHLLGRHQWVGSDGADSALQAYVEREIFNVNPGVSQRRTTADLDFQQRRLLGDRHDLVWGVGWRTSSDDVTSAGIIGMEPRSRRFGLSSVFVHDEITLVPERLRAVIGARLEHNSFTGYEPQPNVRLAWTPTPADTLWAALSGAARTPSRAEDDAAVDLMVTSAGPGMPPVLLRNTPPPDGSLKAERVRSAEAGWRSQLGPTLTVDLAVHHSRYSRLRTAVALPPRFVPGPVPYIEQATLPVSRGKVNVTGLELAAEWRPSRAWRWQLAYTYADMTLRPESDDPIERLTLQFAEGQLPRHQVSLRGGWSGHEAWRLDGWLRHTARLAGNERSPPVDAYTTLDLRVAWRLSPALELSLVGQNLLDARHEEFMPEYLPSIPREVERSAHARLKWRF